MVKTECFPLRLGTRQKCPLKALLYNIILEVLARAVRQKEEIKGIQIGKQKIEAFLFSGNIIVNVKISKNIKRKPLELINELSKIVGYEINKKINPISI